MYQFFVSPEAISESEKRVRITGPDVNHIKNVLRMKTGEELSVSNGKDGREYRCGILSFEEGAVLCELRFIKEDSHELPSKIFLFQGLPKSDKMETIIQKNTELGVYSIVPVEMRRCVVKLDRKKALQKTDRWQAIAEAAAKQSKRGIIPEIMTPVSYSDAVAFAKEHCDILLLPYEMAGTDTGSGMKKTRRILNGIRPGQNIAVFIGPEGGFDEEEVSLAEENGFQTVTLGKRILRTETAGMCLLSILMLLLEP